MLATTYAVVFREEIDPNFPHTMDLAEKCPLVMVNSNELYDLPRPTLSKVVNIGGLGVGFDDAKPLTGESEKIINSGKEQSYSHSDRWLLPTKCPNCGKAPFWKHLLNLQTIDLR
ncbi:unnamed protein product [Caenorhabditis bovis]|uniref:Uncharacterized protein n=1 Tax=Caenorhabditis bovis TaxID=2654633 RepID=A0A8S1EHT0_9PELO|nr:unnamed protein product [Caenorhabditis bovis]